MDIDVELFENDHCGDNTDVIGDDNNNDNTEDDSDDSDGSGYAASLGGPKTLNHNILRVVQCPIL